MIFKFFIDTSDPNNSIISCSSGEAIAYDFNLPSQEFCSGVALNDGTYEGGALHGTHEDADSK